MIVSVGTRRASVTERSSAAGFVPTHVVRTAVPASAEPPVAASVVHATVEIIRHGGGLMPRALVGGTYTPGVGDLAVEVGATGDDVDGVPSCRSDFGSALVPGLPDEFALAALDRLTHVPLPAGRVVIDHAAFDPVESSPSAFAFATQVLAAVVGAKLAGRDVEEAVHQALERR